MFTIERESGILLIKINTIHIAKPVTLQGVPKTWELRDDLKIVFDYR